ncbi:hypothetical protein ACOSP7_021166 [Xanthoceras sorbifolium]
MAPLGGVFKINTDATCFPSEHQTGLGVIIRDNSGRMLSAACSAPLGGVFKINTDATCFPFEHQTGLGVITRDNSGKILLSCAQNLLASFSPFVAEALAIKKGLERAVDASLCPCLLESDASTVVDLISSKDCPTSGVGLIISDILKLMDVACCACIAFIPRVANKPADGLAKMGLSMVGELVFIEEVPSCIQQSSLSFVILFSF